MLKKEISLSLVVMLIIGVVFTLTAQTDAWWIFGGDQQEEVKEIIVAARTGSMAKSLEELSKEYQQESGTKVVITALPYSSLYEKVSMDIRSRSGAFDVIMMDDPWMPEFGQKGFLTPLDQYFPEGPDQDFIDKSIALCKYPYAKGKLVALPLVGNVQLFFYRKDLIEKYQLAKPKSWDDVLTAAEVITKKEQGTYGYTIRGQRGNPVVSNYLPLFWGYGAKVFDDKMNPQVNSAEAKAALKAYLKLKDLGPKGVEAYNSDQIATALTQGRTAMTVAWPSWVSMVDDPSKSKVVGKVDFAVMPTTDKADSAAMIGNWLLGIPASSEHKKEAAKFLKWVTSKKSQKKMALVGGGVPTRVSLYQDQELVEKYRQFPTQLKSLQHSVARPRTPLWNKIEDQWGLYLSKIISKELDIDTGLEKANQAIAKIIKENN
ncbi:carbohydrate ABC transporter substrate-binding protein (CUT1 family) [Orenia metallireducens]|jgi:multiple sugar transport system substrate-binding protein|uniref:Carbohydrate ABC transporter substrate-binding protein, CUT1 family n=1 Tax=Orenia metallireducens TaxID=1413210 RepID=A0A285IDG5_9FIRM|nr:ABC transporter substrate-binding protein [Orenia metallireducens]PRX19653.1 carbohydrate ABC transporter substrate-binding protein (CUT1 family) [Orenia metallireducens]SNY46010.1 carbohydrate ABC transporter substrate-binding protein, CUT1 family [Orenia metallireducens]